MKLIDDCELHDQSTNQATSFLLDIFFIWLNPCDGLPYLLE